VIDKLAKLKQKKNIILNLKNVIGCLKIILSSDFELAFMYGKHEQRHLANLHDQH
jgi:hypothetical protein